MLHAIMHMLLPRALEEMSFAELDQLREEIDLSQAKLCQRGEINPASYSRWRRWVRGDEGGYKPHPRSLKAMRDVLRMEIERRSPQDGLHIAS